jgi:peptide/nickel transport system permease protein
MSELVRRRNPAQALADVLRDLWAEPSGKVGLLIVGPLLLVVAFAPWISPYDPAAQSVANRLEGPSADFWLGTDHIGRDLLSRVMHGSRIALGVAVPAVVGAMLVGLLLGLLAGYLGGRFDAAMLVVTDSLQSFPAVFLALTILALLGPSLQNVVIVVALAFAPGYARVARASVLAVRDHPYVEAERALGAGTSRILFVHVLPNVMAPLFILMAIDLPVAVTIEAGLSFLGVGVPPPEPSWGVILADGFSRVRDAPWPVVWAGVALMVTTLGFTLLGETLRDRLDPTLRDVRRGNA